MIDEFDIDIPEKDYSSEVIDSEEEIEPDNDCGDSCKI